MAAPLHPRLSQVVSVDETTASAGGVWQVHVSQYGTLPQRRRLHRQCSLWDSELNEHARGVPMDATRGGRIVSPFQRVIATLIVSAIGVALGCCLLEAWMF